MTRHSSHSLLATKPARASLALYDIQTHRKVEIDLTDALVSNLGEEEDKYKFYGGYYLFTPQQAEGAKEFLEGLGATSERSFGERNPLYDRRSERVQLPPIAISEIAALHYDGDEQKLSVYVTNGNSGFRHDHQMVRFDVQFDAAAPKGYTISVETETPSKDGEKRMHVPEKRKDTLGITKDGSVYNIVLGKSEDAGVIAVGPSFVGSLATQELSLTTLNSYPGRFTLEEKIKFVEIGLDPKTCGEYPSTARAHTLAQYHSSGISPQLIQETGIDKVLSLAAVVKYQIPTNQVHALAARCGTYFTEIMDKTSGDWQKVVAFDSRYGGYDINDLLKDSISSAEANAYSARASHEIKALKDAGISAEVANAYVAGAYHVIEYQKAGISAEVANPFGKKIPAEDVAFFVKEGVAGTVAAPFYEKTTRERRIVPAVEVWYARKN
ncbi:MAG: hypothetical protein AABX98_04205, partial [Nanoarchaeota archaeon]